MPVVRAAQAARDEWAAQPDELYFTGALASRIARSEEMAAKALGVKEVALVDNSTVATAIVAKRWAGKKVLALSVAYGACLRSLETATDVVVAEVPFPGTTHSKVLEKLETALKKHKPECAFLDQVSSQPAIELPLREMVTLCRQYNVREVAVDAAHAWGCVTDLTIADLDVDVWFTNAHKWLFAPPTVTVLWSRVPLNHVVPSWGSGSLTVQSRWTGTRDYSAYIALQAAIDYSNRWRSIDDLCHREYNRRGLRDALTTLRSAWQVPPAYNDDECASVMGMLPLPPGLDVSNDVPGVPATQPSLRSRLRSQYGVEAAVGAFPVDDGSYQGFLRFSHAVYVSDDDVFRLRDAVLDILRQ